MNYWPLYLTEAEAKEVSEAEGDTDSEWYGTAEELTFGSVTYYIPNAIDEVSYGTQECPDWTDENMLF